MPFGWMRDRPPFDSKDKRLELVRRLNEIPGVELPNEAIDKWPNFPVSAVHEKDNKEKFYEILEWLIQEIRAA
jgi:hypothetical protein